MVSGWKKTLGVTALIGIITAETNYFPAPLLLSPTCNSETTEGLISWVDILLDVYKNHEHGEKMYGRIWLFFTDGASVFCRARLVKCMKVPINPTGNIGKVIYQLMGFNRFTGPRMLLGSCDFRHVLKRFASLLRSEKGIQVGKTLIQRNHVYDALLQIPGMTVTKVKSLISPSDKQNVPVAVNLLQTLLDLEMFETLLDLEKVDLGKIEDPTKRARCTSIFFVAKVFSFFLHPFIKVEMSLGQQTKSLATYGFLSAILYWKHKLDFMGGALYCDSQAVVKGIVFTATRLQVTAEPGTKYFIIHDGTDRQEKTFGEVRTIDHNPNSDIVQTSHKMAMATEAHAIKERNPLLDTGHRRLNLIGARGVDHVNPRSWLGNVCVDGVDIPKMWNEGYKEAVQLVKYFHGDKFIDYDQLVCDFSSGSCDLARPGGYVELKVMRMHVGWHLLLHHFGIVDNSLHTLIGSDPCGFCGLADAGCKTVLTITKKKNGAKETNSIQSTCEYHHKGMQYRSVSLFQLQKGHQCTNVPIQCTLCPPARKQQHPTIWKYNFTSHMAERHCDDCGLFLDRPGALQRKTHINIGEASQLGIKKEAVMKYQEERDFPNTSSLPGSPVLSESFLLAAASPH